MTRMWEAFLKYSICSLCGFNRAWLHPQKSLLISTGLKPALFSKFYASPILYVFVYKVFLTVWLYLQLSAVINYVYHILQHINPFHRITQIFSQSQPIKRIIKKVSIFHLGLVITLFILGFTLTARDHLIWSRLLESH